MVGFKDLIVFLLNSVVLKMLEFMHRSERRASQIKVNNLISIESESNLDSQRY